MIELCCVYSSVRWIWLYIIIIMSRTSLRDNQHFIVRLNVTEVLPQSRHHIWSLSDSNKIWIYNDLDSKRALNQLVKPFKWLSCIVSTYLYGAFDCMLLSCNVQISEWIHTL